MSLGSFGSLKGFLATPSWTRQLYFSYEDCINQEPFSEGWSNWDSGHVWRLSKLSKPCKMCDSCRVSMLRSAQNLAKYMIHAVFLFSEAHKPLWNMWFTLCLCPRRHTNPCKIRDSRCVSLVWGTQTLVKYVIHVVFLYSEAQKTL